MPPGQSSLAPPPVSPLPVQTPGGQVIDVLGPEEQAYYNAQAQRYTTEYAFSNVSDLADLDQLLFLETQLFRFSRYLGTGRDYDQRDVDFTSTRRAMKEVSELATKIKTTLGMTKTQRDKEQAESVSSYLIDLKRRAKEFGVHRENQLTTGISLCMELFSIVGSFDRADKTEREKLGYEDEAAIIEWIRSTMRPKFDEVDAYFRANQQRYWLKDL